MLRELVAGSWFLKRILLLRGRASRIVSEFDLPPEKSADSGWAMMESLAEWMGQPQSVWLLVGILVVIACYGAVRFEVVMDKCRGKLAGTLKILRALKGPGDFAASFDPVCAAVRSPLASDRSLLEAWEAYSRGLLVMDGRVSAQRTAEDFFQTAVVLQHPAVLWYRNLPGMLVGLGLVCTFLGIAVVIHQASIAMADTRDPTALSAILSAAALKFWTSLAGVGLSMICGHHGRTKIQLAGIQLRKLTHELNALAPVPGLHSLVEEFSRLRRDVSVVAGAALDGLVAQASEVMQQAVKDSLGSVGVAVKGLSKELTHLSGDLKGVVSQICTASSSLENATKLLESAVGESGRRVRDDFANVSASAAATKECFATMAADATKAGKTVNKLATIADQVKSAVDGLARLNGVPEKLTAAGDSLRKTAGELASLWAGYSGKIEGLDRQLAGTLTTLPEVFKQYATALASYTKGLDEHVETTLIRLMEWVQRIEALQREAAHKAEEPPEPAKGLPARER